MTGQQEADALLAGYQANKARLKEISERFEALMFDFFQGPLPSSVEYEATLRMLSEAMAAA